eukprot:jgi/Chrpa1/24777/Chrysochromulina_OHIO_Genome00026396-RA
MPGGRLRPYAPSAEFNTIASTRTLAERIACTSYIACVAWRCTRMSRGSWRAGFHSSSQLRAYGTQRRVEHDRVGAYVG